MLERGETSVEEIFASAGTLIELIDRVQLAGGITYDRTPVDLKPLREALVELDQGFDSEGMEDKALAVFKMIDDLPLNDKFIKKLKDLFKSQYVDRIKDLDMQALAKQEKDGYMARIISAATTSVELIDNITKAGGLRTEDRDGFFRDLKGYRNVVDLSRVSDLAALKRLQAAAPELLQTAPKTLGFQDKLRELFLRELEAKEQEFN